MELISVIVPVYKVEAYLDKCVSSIVNQTYKNLQIILVDDGSPDSCPDICDEWAKKDSRIKVIHKENGGLSDARNAGLCAATGNYISFADSDDYLEPEFFKTLSDMLLKNDSDIAECAVRLVDESGLELRLRGIGRDITLNKTEALCRLVKEDGVYQTVWNKLYKKELLGGIPFEKGRLHEDEFFTYKVFDRINKISICSKPLYNYLQRSSSIMGSGYSLGRCDALDARFERMLYLQKYPATAALTARLISFDYMYHLQKAILHLKGDEQKYAIKKIMRFKKQTPKLDYSGISLKNRIWLMLFNIFPRHTARIRNALKIGI